MATSAPTIGDNIAAEMKRKRISQTMLAAQLGLSQAAVSARLRGSVDWRLNEVVAIADFLGVPVSALLADQGLGRSA